MLVTENKNILWAYIRVDKFAANKILEVLAFGGDIQPFYLTLLTDRNFTLLQYHDQYV